MEFSLLQRFLTLSPFEATLLAFAGSVIVYSGLLYRVHILLFMLVLSAALVGNTIGHVENMAVITRLVAIVLLLLGAMFRERLRPSPGCVLFWGYVASGFISLLNAINPSWQFQKTVLLLLLVICIPFAYSTKDYKSLKSTLIAISLAGAAFSLFQFTALPSQLGKAARFSGYFKGAPAYTLVHAAFLPFMLWGSWRAGTKLLRIISGTGFLLGIVTLTLSGQRTGTLAGLVGTIPLMLMLLRRRTIAWSLLLVILPLLLGHFLLQSGSRDRATFLLNRYSSSDLSGRPSVWKRALLEIDKHPFLGRGIGASENVIHNSFHNTYLEVWFNSGLLGLFLFLAAQVYFVCKALWLMRLSREGEVRSLAALAFGVMTGFMLICLSESAGAGATNVNLILYFLLGIIVSNDQVAAYAPPPNDNNLMTSYP